MSLDHVGLLHWQDTCEYDFRVSVFLRYLLVASLAPASMGRLMSVHPCFDVLNTEVDRPGRTLDQDTLTCEVAKNPVDVLVLSF